MNEDFKSPPNDRNLRVAMVLSVLLLGGHDAAAGMPAAGTPAVAETPAAGTLAAEVSAEFEVVPSIGHFQGVDRIVYTPDGQWLISSGGRGEGTSRVWRDGRLRHVLRGGLATVAPDGQTVVTAVTGHRRHFGAVRRYRVASGELLWETPSPTVSGLAVTPDGTRVVAACDDRSARIWDLETGGLMRRFDRRASWLGQLALTSDGSLAATNRGETVLIWPVPTEAETVPRRWTVGQPLRDVRCELEDHRATISGLAFAADGSYLASSDSRDVVRLWDPVSCRAKAVLQLQQGGARRLDRLALSPDGKVLVAAGDRTAWMWNVESEELLSSYRVEGEEISAVVFDRRGEWLAIGHERGRISLLKPGQEQPFRTLRSGRGLSWIEPSPAGDELAVGHLGVDILSLTAPAGRVRLKNFKRHVSGVRISDDGAQVISESPGTIRIWDLETGRPPVELEGSRALSSTDGAVVAVGGRERSDGIRIWHRDTLGILDRVRHDAVVTAFDLDRGGEVLATAADDGTVRLWNARTGERLKHFAGPSSAASDVVLAEDARAVVASYADGSLWVWNLEGDAPRHVLYHPETRETWQMLAMPSASRLLTTVVGGGTYLWDLERGGIARRLVEEFVAFGAAAFAADSRLVMSLISKPEVEVWSAATGRRLFSLRGHRVPVAGLAVLDQGRQIVTGAGDGTLGWWRAADGERRRLLPMSRSGITALTASSAGDLLLTGDRDGAVRIRQASDGEEIVRLLSSPAGGWAVVTPDGRWHASLGGRDPGFTVWSGHNYGLLADHPGRHVPGLLAEVMRPYVEAEGVEGR